MGRGRILKLNLIGSSMGQNESLSRVTFMFDQVLRHILMVITGQD